MQHFTEQLPVFVYGTLRTGQGNWQCFLQGRTIATHPAIAPDQKMYVTNYAYVTDGPGYQVIGELMEIQPQIYEQVMRDLDGLEDYDPRQPERGLYVRVQREVVVIRDDGRERRQHAWIYHLNPCRRDSYSDADLVIHGDWLRHEQSAR